LLWFSLFALLLFAFAVNGQQMYLFGMDEVDTTPTQEMIDNREVWLGGYGIWKARGFPTGIHDPIMTYCWVVEDGNTTVAFMVSDVIGISNVQTDRIKFAVSEQTSIHYDNVHVSSTHTHSGSDLQGLWGGASQRYRDMFVDYSSNCIINAFNRREPAHLFVSSGNGTNWARNRRGHNWTNDLMSIISAFAIATGERLGTFLNFAVHPVVLDTDNREFSADFVYYFRSYVKEGLGGDAPVAFVQGAQGDVNPRSGEQCCYDTFACCEACGSGMAASALSFVAQGMIPVSGPIYSATHYYNHRVSNPGFILAYEIGWLDYTMGNGTDPYSFDTAVSHWQIGQLSTINFPGESLTYNSYPVLQAIEATQRHGMIFGLTGDSIGYLVPTEEWDPSTGYEEKVSIDRMFGDNSQAIALDLVNNRYKQQQD